MQEYYDKCRDYSAKIGKDVCRNQSEGAVSSIVVDATNGYDVMWLAARALHGTNLKNISHFRDYELDQRSIFTSSLYNFSINDKFDGASVSHFLYDSVLLVNCKALSILCMCFPP